MHPLPWGDTSAELSSCRCSTFSFFLPFSPQNSCHLSSDASRQQQLPTSHVWLRRTGGNYWGPCLPTRRRSILSINPTFKRMGQITRAEGQRGPGTRNALNRSLKCALEPLAEEQQPSFSSPLLRSETQCSLLGGLKKKSKYNICLDCLYWLV